ncbi:hypothetical protein KBY58_03385 [Cyanobium sp. HWJ4-Hawea]|uniref:hypothetical protein n=1 Tax=Cyanobium sp. HWJ4-Hawea TaxID=2823713 RepID=UPI0020CD233F|nr:hypothetical protein [Cyanobium sp. HWJ4-Hawea]MCP9808476.1 hypothetical protein [Cyanobium sp. HWJ4-Hawea]
MKTLALSGGLGNVLFQLNLFYSRRSLFDSLSPEGLHIKMLRKVRRLNSPQQSSFLKMLGISCYLKQTPQTLADYFLLGFSRKVDNPVCGRYWNNFIDPIDTTSPVRLFKSYAQYQVPLQDEFIALLKKCLIEPRSHLRSLASGYDAIGHIRCGDLSRTVDISGYYLEAFKIYPNILLVTDDACQASRLFPGLDSSRIISSRSYLDDFAILAYANNIVSSNSTFAWWAAELSSACSVVEPYDFRLGSHFKPISNRLRHRL